MATLREWQEDVREQDFGDLETYGRCLQTLLRTWPLFNQEYKELKILEKMIEVEIKERKMLPDQA